jgi:hypothetical protein
MTPTPYRPEDQNSIRLAARRHCRSRCKRCGAVRPVIGSLHLLLNWRFKVRPAPSLVRYWITPGLALPIPCTVFLFHTASTWTRHKAGMKKKPSVVGKGTPTSSWHSPAAPPATRISYKFKSHSHGCYWKLLCSVTSSLSWASTGAFTPPPGRSRST